MKTQVRYLANARWSFCALAVLVLGGFYFCGYRQLSVRWFSVRTEIDAKRERLGSAQLQALQLPKVAAEVEVLRQKLSSAKRLTENQDLGKFIRSINAFAAEASFENLTVQPGVPRRGSTVSQLPISLSFKGNFLSAYDFVGKVEALPRLLSVETLHIQSIDRGGGAVDVQLSMNLYFAEQP